MIVDDRSEWTAIVDELLAVVGWTLREAGLSAEDIDSAELVPAGSDAPGHLLRGEYVALRLRSGAELQMTRGGMVLAPTRPPEAET